MPLPELTLGLVVRYEYLWHRRSAVAAAADKERPACVMAIFRHHDRPGDFVVYLPISHTPPSGDEEGIELPAGAKTKAGLDAAPQWVMISECNVDTWPFDVRSLPERPDTFHYGHLPPRTFKLVRDRFVARYRARRIRVVNRDKD